MQQLAPDLASCGMGSKKQRRQPRPTALPHSSSSNDDFRALYPRIARAQQARTSAALLVAELEAQLEAIRARLESARNDVVDTDRECVEAETTMVTLRPRLCFRRDLPDCVALTILGSQLGHRARGRAARVCRDFRATVGKARELKLFKSWIFAISAGESHTVACTQSGLCSFGAGDNGRLGHGGGDDDYRDEDVLRAVKALAGKEVVGASAGDCHTVVWTEAGEVYTFGAGVDGRLGHGGEEDENVPRVVEALEGEGVVGASAGKRHTVAWTEAGEVYSFGRGESGKLGHGGDEDELAPRVVQALAGQKVVGASAGAFHTVVWTEAGEVFTFGNGRYGQLGHGGEEDEIVPRVLEALDGKEVVGASAGKRYTVVWTEAGEVYTFGYGEHGRLGHGGEEDKLAPRVVEALAGQKVVGASAGDSYTVLWTEAGEVYSFGYGGYGQLGHGDQEGGLVPRVVEALAGQKVVGASAGAFHTAAWTEAGEVFTFGNGRYGQLGHGGGEDENVPRVVKMFRRWHKGKDH